MTDPASNAPDFDLLAGSLCLDLTNTKHRSSSGSQKDELDTYADLVAWNRQAGQITAARAAVLLGAGRDEPARAQRVLARTRNLREAVYRICAAHEKREQPARPKPIPGKPTRRARPNPPSSDPSHTGCTPSSTSAGKTTAGPAGDGRCGGSCDRSRAGAAEIRRATRSGCLLR